MASSKCALNVKQEEIVSQFQSNFESETVICRFSSSDTKIEWNFFGVEELQFSVLKKKKN